MKKLSDGAGVPDRCYYYLLSFRDENLIRFEALSGKQSLHELNYDEFWDVFKYATEFDYSDNCL